MKEYRKLLAHFDVEDPKKKQFLVEHLFEVSRIAKELGSSLKLKSSCELIGLLHDFGKYKIGRASCRERV